jgi:hypothetical protein
MDRPARARALVLAAALLTACGKEGPKLPACPASDEILTVPWMAVEAVGELTPLGNLNPPGHVFPTEHQYLYLADAGAATPIVAAGPLVLVEVASSEHLSAEPPFVDYDLTLSVCDGLSFRLGHVATLDGALAARIGGATGGDCQTYSTGGQDYRRCRRTPSAALAPGDAIGTAGVNPGQWALDVGTHDLRKPPVALVAASAYGDAAYGRCFLDYATAEVQAAFYAKVLRSEAPRCGTQGQDLAGTAQGNWRRAGAPTYPEDPHLALVHDMKNPAQVALSFGTSLPPLSGVAWPPLATTGRANRDPSAVTSDGEAWCWDAGGGRLVVTLPTASTLRAEGQAGACGEGPWTLSGAAVAFGR